MSPPRVVGGRLINADNLKVMHTWDGEKPDMVYIDPPFVAASVESRNFGDVMSAMKSQWRERDDSDFEMSMLPQELQSFVRGACRHYEPFYRSVLQSVVVRLSFLPKFMSPHGVMFLHVPVQISHLFRMALDIIFSHSNFLNEIVWRGGATFLESDARGRFVSSSSSVLMYRATSQHIWNEGGATRYEQVVMPMWDGGTRTRRVRIGKHDTLWTDIDPISAEQDDESLFSVKPVDLVMRMIDASTRVGDTVFDMYCGTGSACVAAKLRGRRFIGVDTDEGALRIAARRLAEVPEHESLVQELRAV